MELTEQEWDRGQSTVLLAEGDGIKLTGELWAAIVFMRKYCLKRGLPILRRLHRGFLARKAPVLYTHHSTPAVQD